MAHSVMPMASGVEEPRVLFVTAAAFNRITGGGITFSSLFRSWPADRLATVHNDPVPVSNDVCRRYYRLGSEEISRWPRSAWLDSAVAAGSAPEATVPSSNFLRRAKQFIAGNAWLDRGAVTPELHHWISEFQPTLIYSILGTIGMMELVDDIRQRFGLKLAVHFMDDWPSTLYRGGVFSPLFRRRMDRLIERLVGVASIRLGISDAMCEAYERRYGTPFISVQNPANSAPNQPVWVPASAGSPSRVVYVGSLLNNAQSESTIDLAKSVVRLNSEGRRIIFDIYSPNHLAERFRSRIEIDPAVRLHDTISDDKVFFATIAAADALVLPVNFDADSVNFIRYSMPTKVPAYLAAGAPILVYGPEQTAQVRYAMRDSWGLPVTKRDPAALDAGLTRALFDDPLRLKVVAAARAAAQRNHDPDVVRARFRTSLIAAAE
jgi:hypothetical protein